MTTKRLTLAGRLRSFDAITVLLGTVALCMIGPLRAFTEAHSHVAFASTFVLFMVPGIFLSRWFISEYFQGSALVPVAFVLSASIFGVLAVPMLVLHANLGAYLWVSGVLVLAFLGSAALRALLGSAPEPGESNERARNLLTHLPVGVLWVPFAALSTALAYTSAAGAQGSTATCGYTCRGCGSSSVRITSPSLIRTLTTKWLTSLA